MSGPQRQQLADVQTVTPALTDKAVTIQAGKVKTSLYSAIYNLFKAGFDLIYLTAADLVGYATESYADAAASTAGSNAITTANGYTDTEVATKQDLFDYSGSASGVTPLTINTVLGGTAEFTDTVNANATKTLRINSDQIEVTSKIIYTLVYNGAGFPQILSHVVSSTRVDFLVANIDVTGSGGTNTDSPLTIEYQIVA